MFSVTSIPGPERDKYRITFFPFYLDGEETIEVLSCGPPRVQYDEELYKRVEVELVGHA